MAGKKKAGSGGGGGIVKSSSNLKMFCVTHNHLVVVVVAGRGRGRCGGGDGGDGGGGDDDDEDRQNDMKAAMDGKRKKAFQFVCGGKLFGVGGGCGSLDGGRRYRRRCRQRRRPGLKGGKNILQISFFVNGPLWRPFLFLFLFFCGDT